MRKILTILTICLITILGANYMVTNYLDKIEQEKIEKIKQEKIAKNIKIEQKIKVKTSDKIKALRKRFELKGLIKKGDTYLENEQHILAIKYYLIAIKESPNDKTLIKKLGDIYFEKKDFNNAYNYYQKLIGTDFIDSQKIAITYFYTLSKDKSKLNFEKIYSSINNFNLDKDNNFFYKTSIECISNKKACQDKFEKYVKNYRGQNQNILYIKKAFDDYNSFQVKEQYFKDTQILIAFFKAKIYSVTNILAKDILKEKINYLPVIKVLAKGNFEIGNDKEAKKYLLQYNEVDPNDPKVNYMLGIININLDEYILSNIYFIKALKLNHENKFFISRRLIYNYYLDGNNDKMLTEFKNLINNGNDLNSTDYSLAIYYAFINGENIIANKWTSKALQLYPKNDIFYAYKGWFYKENREFDKAEYYLKKGLKINISNPLINLNMGIIEADKGNLLKAKIFLRNTIKQDIDGNFGKEAAKRLEEIYLEEERIKNEIEESLEEF